MKILLRLLVLLGIAAGKNQCAGAVWLVLAEPPTAGERSFRLGCAGTNDSRRGRRRWHDSPNNRWRANVDAPTQRDYP